jgi:hypothetical protein
MLIISGYSYQTIEGVDNVLILHINEKTNFLPPRFYGFSINPNHTKYYYKNSVLHRDGDLPAIEWEDGSKAYYKNSLMHRDNDLPAFVHINGSKEYWKDGVEYCPQLKNQNTSRE